MIGELPEIVKICGREFRLARKTTIARDSKLEQVLEDYGLKDAQRLYNEPEEDYQRRIYQHVVNSGAWASVLAVRLDPVGEKWTEDAYNATLAALGEVDDEEEKLVLLRLVPWVVAGFFVAGLISQRVSQTSSQLVEGDGPGVLVLKIRLAHGARWPERLRASILAGFRSFWIVISANPSPATTKS